MKSILGRELEEFESYSAAVDWVKKHGKLYYKAPLDTFVSYLRATVVRGRVGTGERHGEFVADPEGPEMIRVIEDIAGSYDSFVADEGHLSRMWRPKKACDRLVQIGGKW